VVLILFMVLFGVVLYGVVVGVLWCGRWVYMVWSLVLYGVVVLMMKVVVLKLQDVV